MSWTWRWKGELMTPFDRAPMPKNDPALLELVELRSLGGFCLNGKRVEIGTIVKVQRFIANDLIWQHKAEPL
jgi:hypothetical protein